jgi:citronellol/citronellal dehydrogenase
MSNHQQPFFDRTLVVSGSSRGIGQAIALGAAKRGANVVLLAKTAEPRQNAAWHRAHRGRRCRGPGQGAAVVGDVRREEDVARAVDTAVERFGGVDVMINNASAIATEPTEQLAAKKFDLMTDINVRGTFLLTKAAPPHLRKSATAHVLTLAPPLNMNPYWSSAHPSYLLSKYRMTLLRRAGRRSAPTQVSGLPACGPRLASGRQRWPTRLAARGCWRRRALPTPRSKSCPGPRQW